MVADLATEQSITYRKFISTIIFIKIQDGAIRQNTLLDYKFKDTKPTINFGEY
jgi:hypothetical protein